MDEENRSKVEGKTTSSYKVIKFSGYQVNGFNYFDFLTQIRNHLIPL